MASILLSLCPGMVVVVVERPQKNHFLKRCLTEGFEVAKDNSWFMMVVDEENVVLYSSVDDRKINGDTVPAHAESILAKFRRGLCYYIGTQETP